jgi:hypothetical protein
MMVVGVDVCPDKNENKTVVALVASMNGNEPDKLNSTKYYSKCTYQDNGSASCTIYQSFIKGFFCI